MRRGFWYGVLLGAVASAAALLVVAPRLARRQGAAANGAGRVKPAAVPTARRPEARGTVIGRRPAR